MRTVPWAALLLALGCSPSPSETDLSTSKQPLTLSDPVELDTAVRATEVPAMPVQVRNDGQNFIVAWTESRSITTDVYTTRVSPTGVVLDPYAVRASRAVDGMSGFGFAVGGGQQLTAWEEWTEPGVLIESALGAPAQLPSWSRLDVVPADTMAGGVAATFDGTAFDLVMPHGNGEALNFVRVFPDGGVSPRTIIVPGVGTAAQDVIAVARSGSSIGVTSYENGSGYINHFTTVDPATGSVTSHQALGTGNARPLVVGDALGFVIADVFNNVGKNHILLRRSSAGGAFIGDAGWDVSATALSQMPYALDTLPNGNTVIAYADQSGYTYPGIKEVSEDGGAFSLVGDYLITDAGSISTNSSISCMGPTCLMVWSLYGFPSTLTGALYSQGAVTTPPFLLRTGSRAQFTPKTAFAQDRYLVTWTEHSSTALQYYGRFLDEIGVPLTPPFQLLELNDFSALSSPGIGTFEVLELGGRFVFVNTTRGSPPKATARFVEVDGGSGVPFDIATTGTQPKNNIVSATNGSTALLVWMSYDVSAGHWKVYGARITSDGTVLDPEGFLIADTGFAGPQMAVSAGERGFQVVWSDTSGGFSPPRLLTASVDLDGGTLSNTRVLLTLSGRNFALAPSLVFDGTHHLATYIDKPGPIASVRLIQFDEDGGTTGDGGELLSTPGAPSLNGEFVCRGPDCTAVFSELSGGAFQLRGLQFSSDGGRHDLGSSLATQADDEVSADIALGDAGWLLAWSRYQGAPHGAARAVSRVIDGPVQPIPDAGVEDGGASDAGSVDGGGVADAGGALEPMHLRVGCGCGAAPDVMLLATLLTIAALRVRRRSGVD